MIIELHGNFEEGILDLFEESFRLAQKKDDVIIDIASDGGYAYVLEEILGMMKVFRRGKTKVHTHCSKQAYSCGSILLMQGDERTADPFASIMIHNVGVQLEGKLGDLKKSVEELEEFNKSIYKDALKRTKLSYNALQKILETKDNNDWFMSSEEAIKYKIIDRISS